ncbi:arginine--tRNA ligase [Fulvivirgaceae bacterium PWU4]|uniref:Arginine--tRNA ligase n=1 Tax=Chryseosolibacter histidini TaxID=2782349 RepID=A0AAP2GK07_9BACT|nr:arginine--tRNA ligase [Chryseosolibacter histidini]MBT1698544.1 arginine--tRNA ligase [Chryseosolibacter histidini]
MNLDTLLRSEIQKSVLALFGQQVENFQLQPTNQEFEGSHTLVCFPLTKISKKNPEETAKAIGEYLVANSGIVSRFNVVKGFLNLVLGDSVWLQMLEAIYTNPSFGQLPDNGEEIMIEYSSPNTNKPLHLGHLRNNFLGWSVAEIYKANGYKVHKVQIINDRGIHICKSMAAWTLYGDGETPQTSGMKGDHLVGKYYVEFDKAYKAQVKALIEKGASEAEAEKQAPIMKLASEMLRKWEQKDSEVLQLWSMMNGWVYKGFNATYEKMGVDFDKLYYESDTYLLGKEEVMKGLEKGVFFKKEDGSVWVDLTGDGLDQKVLLRADGTSVYMTQDIGTAILRFRDFPKIGGQVYTVGNEQEYHFKVLFLILGKLGYEWAKRCYHLSYGMVDLPTGKMKSREGTVVDADDLIDEMVKEAEQQTRELGKVEDLTPQEARQLFEMIGLGALKFFLLKVDPKKRMLFDPNESIQLQGFTGPFIQYTHARIRAILRKAESLGITVAKEDFKVIKSLEPAEREVLQVLQTFEGKIKEAAREYAPSIVANLVYELAKEYNQFYQNIPIFNEADAGKLKGRIALSKAVADAIKKGMQLLGIQVPERM